MKFSEDDTYGSQLVHGSVAFAAAANLELGNGVLLARMHQASSGEYHGYQ